MNGIFRRLTFGVLLLLLTGVAAVAQLPPIIPLSPEPGKEPPVRSVPVPAPTTREQLKADLSALLGDRKELPTEDSLAAERARLQSDLRLLLSRIESRPVLGPAIVPTPPVRPTPISPPDGQAVNPLRRAMNEYRENNFGISYDVFRYIDVNALAREDRVFVQYMKASCLRRLNRLNEAAVAYREIADAHEDDFFSDCAIWQLSMIRDAQELEGQIEQIRARTKSR
jgi:hypothetical protein